MFDAENEVSPKALEEIAAEQRKERAQLRKDAELMQQLIAHPAWARYFALIETNAQVHMQQVLRPLEHALEFTKGEYAKGTLNGLSLAAGLPSSKIREAQDLLGNVDAEE